MRSRRTADAAAAQNAPRSSLHWALAVRSGPVNAGGSNSDANQLPIDMRHPVPRQDPHRLRLDERFELRADARIGLDDRLDLPLAATRVVELLRVARRPPQSQQ